MWGRRKDVWEHGTRTTATVERVGLTTVVVLPEGGSSRSPYLKTHLTYRLDDGAVMEAAQAVKFWKIPPPGSRVEVAYLDDRIEFDPATQQPPDPAVPRGWSAGVFGDGRDGYERQRELFRSGAGRCTAVVVAAEQDTFARGGSKPWTLTLETPDGSRRTARAHILVKTVPEPGFTLEIATGGGLVALDTDDRCSGTPDQALVVRGTPRPRPASPPAPSFGAAEVDAQLARLAAVRDRMGVNYARAVEALLAGAVAQGLLTEAEAQERRLASEA